MGTRHHYVKKNLSIDALNKNTINNQDPRKGVCYHHNNDNHIRHHCHHPSADNIKDNGGVGGGGLGG